MPDRKDEHTCASPKLAAHARPKWHLTCFFARSGLLIDLCLDQRSCVSAVFLPALIPASHADARVSDPAIPEGRRHFAEMRWSVRMRMRMRMRMRKEWNLSRDADAESRSSCTWPENDSSLQPPTQQHQQACGASIHLQESELSRTRSLHRSPKPKISRPPALITKLCFPILPETDPPLTLLISPKLTSEPCACSIHHTDIGKRAGTPRGSRRSQHLDFPPVAALAAPLRRGGGGTLLPACLIFGTKIANFVCENARAGITLLGSVRCSDCEGLVRL